MKANIVSYKGYKFLIIIWWEACEDQYKMRLSLIDDCVDSGCVNMEVDLGNDVKQPADMAFGHYINNRGYEKDFCDDIISGAKAVGIIKKEKK
jgi:hypothetical protein